MSLTFHANGVTDIGRKRKRNEDALLVLPEIGLFAVADGMGGAAAGEVASQRAVEVVRAFVTERAQILRDFAADPTPDRGAAAARLVEQAIQTACHEIHRMAETDVRLRGMGTTFVCLAIAGDRGVVAHAGDSRLYLARRGQAYVLTEDHTLIASQIKAGEIRPEDAERSPFKGVLTRALGQYESVQVDSLVVDLLPGDAFLLCSDGLHGYFSDEELAERFSAGVTDGLAADLVTAANERGGRDNITAIVVGVTDVGAEVPVSMARIDALMRIPLFEHLTYREQNEVLAIARTRTYPAGATIVREGEPGGICSSCSTARCASSRPASPSRRSAPAAISVKWASWTRARDRPACARRRPSAPW
ncbi:Protein serine/threonine phosphatase PrpC, regulation of stationary phase [Minicystis rosea]|nr:Protein serine/threonine phosphatase PrpC, regulation of stationary phase [Minicystis rosea]